MHPVLFELGMLLTKNPISSDAAVLCCSLFLQISFSLIYVYVFSDKCFSYHLQVFKKCTYSVHFVQCVCVRAPSAYPEYTKNEPYCRFSSFHRSFSIFLVFISPHLFVVLFFNLFFSHRYNRCVILLPLCTQDYTKSTPEMLNTNDAETGIIWIWIYTDKRMEHIFTHPLTH